jgi:peptidyl-prolyl cis-trans isomerase C
MSFIHPFDARLLSAVALAAFLIAPIGSRAQETDPVVARANGVDIRQSDLAMAESDIGTAMPQMGPDQKRDYLITYLADVIILAQAADQQQLANRNEVKHRIEFERHKALMEALLQDAGKAAMTDDAMHKIYDEAIKQTPNEEEVHARHILVATEGEAKDIEAQLKKGADFATLAKEKSKDPGAGIRRGRFQAREGADFRSGEDAIRLAHHRARRQAHKAHPDIRSSQRTIAELRCSPRASGASR